MAVKHLLAGFLKIKLLFLNPRLSALYWLLQRQAAGPDLGDSVERPGRSQVQVSSPSFFLEQGAECHWEDRVKCQLLLAKIYRSVPAAAKLASFRN